MNKISLKIALASSMLLASAGYTGMVAAATVCLTSKTLLANVSPNPVGADLYRVSCTGAATGLRTRIDLRAGTQVQVQVGREGYGAGATASALASDTSTADITGCPTPLPTGAGITTMTPTAPNGPGGYNVLVNKTTTTATTYDIDFDCVGGTTTVLTPAPVIDR